MTFSRLWSILFALGGVPLLFTGLNTGLLYVALGWSGLLTLLAVVDWFLLPPPEALEVERNVDEKLSLAAENPVRVRVRDGAKMSVRWSCATRLPWRCGLISMKSLLPSRSRLAVGTPRSTTSRLPPAVTIGSATFICGCAANRFG